MKYDDRVRLAKVISADFLIFGRIEDAKSGYKISLDVVAVESPKSDPPFSIFTLFMPHQEAGLKSLSGVSKGSIHKNHL